MPSSPGFFHRHRVATLVVVVALLTVGLLFAAEAYLAWRHPAPAQETFRAIRLREHRPGLDQVIAMPEKLLHDPDSLQLSSVHLGVDADGFIQPSRVHEHADHTVVFLGGSTTECLWVQEENRFPYLAGRLIEKSGNYGTVNALNGGRAANHSLHSIAALLGKVVPIAPEVCVLMHNCNDLMVLLNHQTYWTTQIAYRNMLEYKKPPKESIGWQVRQLTAWMFPNLRELFTPANASDELAELRGKEPQVDEAFIADQFKKSLLTFVRLCRTWDIAPVLMTQANRVKEKVDDRFSFIPDKLKADFGVDYATYFRLYHQMNAMIREVGAQERVLVIDLAAHVPQESKYLYDLYHFNDEGSKRAAQVIAEELPKAFRHP